MRDPGPGPVRLGRLADPGPGLVPFIGPAGQQGFPGQRVNGWQGQAFQHRVIAHARNVVRAPGLQRRHQLLPGIPSVETDHRLLAEKPLRPVQDPDDEAEAALCRVRRPPAEPDIEEIPRLAHRRHQGMVDPGPVVAVPLASRLSAVNLRRQAVQVDHEPLRQPAVVHGPDPPSREPRKPVAKHLGVLPLPQRRHHPRQRGLRRQRPPQRCRPRPVAHPEAQRRVSAQRPRVVVIPAALGREKERGA